MPSEACIDRLSPELLMPIMKALPDIGSVSSFLMASPTAYRIFSAHDVAAIEIFESCLSGGLLHSHTCALIRNAAQVRSWSLPSHVNSLQSLRKLVRFETTTWRCITPEWDFPVSTLPPSAELSTPRTLLARYCKIERSTEACLEFYLQRFRPLSPRQVADNTFASYPISLKFQGQKPCACLRGSRNRWRSRLSFKISDLLLGLKSNVYHGLSGAYNCIMTCKLQATQREYAGLKLILHL